MRPGELEYLENLADFFSNPGVKVEIYQKSGFFSQQEVNDGDACGCFGAWIAYDRELGYIPGDPEKEPDARDGRLEYDMGDGAEDFERFVSPATAERLAKIAGVGDPFGTAEWKVPPAEALQILIKDLKGGET